jgi:transketolase
LLVLRSHIGYPAPDKMDTAAAHGNPLGADEVAKVKAILNMPAEDFWAPDDVVLMYREAGTRGVATREAWEALTKPDEYWGAVSNNGLHGWEQKLPTWQAGESIATRSAIEDVLTAVVDVVPGLFTGSGDLTGNTGMNVKSLGVRTPSDATGRLIHYGIREHTMGAIANGLAVTGLVPCVGTFFVFSDYMRPAVRLASIMQAKVAFVWTHDSVGVGEDGPTHQPIEQLAAMRAMPGLRVIRPADANEVAAAWRVHLEGDGPTAIVLTRQKVPVLDGTAEHADTGVPKGAYTLVAEDGSQPDVVLVGTGSEVSVCVEARTKLSAAGIDARVVSMPSWDCFDAQGAAYYAEVLPPGVPVLAVEAATRFGWERYADAFVTIDRFGASAPGEVVLRELGINPEHVVAEARALLGQGGS